MHFVFKNKINKLLFNKEKDKKIYCLFFKLLFQNL